jgi:nucleoside-diphosphate-sugar epimerase
MTVHQNTADPLLSRILGRSRSIFADDMDGHEADLYKAIFGKRLMIAGAAGSIGFAFIKQVLRYKPASLHLIDPDENSLVEVVRNLRSSSLSVPEDFKTFSIGIGSMEFEALMNDKVACDCFVNFAALKHVRSERDAYSLLRMINVNVRALRDVLSMASVNNIGHVFSVSSDKAVNPANLMGASKSLMEKLLWSYGDNIKVSTARFANVAFSAGSLLEGFELRLKNNQPLAGPKDIKRYFISHEEAGQFCLLACFLSDKRQIFIPKLEVEKHLQSFQDIAIEYLAYNNFAPNVCLSEDEARSVPVGLKGEWPVFFSKSDTMGEKFVEVFAEDDAFIDYSNFKAIGTINAAPVEQNLLDEFLIEIEALQRKKPLSLDAIVEVLKKAVPELHHVERRRNLDQKM